MRRAEYGPDKRQSSPEITPFRFSLMAVRMAGLLARGSTPSVSRPSRTIHPSSGPEAELWLAAHSCGGSHGFEIIALSHRAAASYRVPFCLPAGAGRTIRGNSIRERESKSMDGAGF